MPTQEDDFSLITAGTAAGSAAGWDFASGTTAIFNTGTLQDIQLFSGNGESFVSRTDAPDQLHQRVEVVMPLATLTVTYAYSGVFARYVDTSNYVLARFNHLTGVCELIERVAGVSTTIATAPITAALDVTGVSVRLEIVDNRARLFFEPHYRPIPDQPPDIAANLTGTYTVPGQWGIYLKADGTNNCSVSRFLCRELPARVGAVPTLSVASASGNALVAFTAAAGSVPSSATYLEWEVYPVDSEDFPEAYKELSLASMTSRVFFGRAGYTYDVRVRTVKKSGGYGDWVTERLTITGSQTLPSTPTMPPDAFPDVTPDYVLGQTASGSTFPDMAQTGRERVIANQPYPRVGFDLSFRSRTRDEILLIEDFFMEMRGQLTPFSWTHPITGVDYAVRFASDDLEPKAIDDEYDGTGAIYDLDVSFEQIAYGVAATISLSLAVDSSLIP